ncbi:hypothetical protein CC80DRAFT_62372 [Byssothecium circinans]|uniref:F-box domain-containing protein n=1 Tax=Byssothecium circinans TaxID=147558 RepID=A0A6A5TUP3_9PLEO|nr:hypothetical protein CC80DRAFT_62372 [Byssothecium circinans]
MEPTSPAPGSLPHRLLNLPLNIRKKIYQFTLNRKKTIEIEYHSRPASASNHLAICRANRQTYAEALPIFYKHHIFSAKNLKQALLILKQSPDALKNIRHVIIHFLELFSDVVDQVVYGTHEELRNLCYFLGEHGHLYSLILQIHHKDLLEHHELILGYLRTKHGELPPWINHVAAIKNLERLCVQWSRGPVSELSTMMLAANTMRARMVSDGPRLDEECVDLRIRRRHVLVQKGAGPAIRTKERKLELRMLVDTSGMENLDCTTVRRVRVIPYCWCTGCGKFEGKGSDQCRLAGTLYQGKREEVGTILQLGAGGAAETASFPDGVWNCLKWGGKPLVEYLPEAVTEEEFQTAKEWAEEGHALVLRGGVEGEYAESDCGDTDSLISFHG